MREPHGSLAAAAVSSGNLVGIRRMFSGKFSNLPTHIRHGPGRTQEGTTKNMGSCSSSISKMGLPANISKAWC
jgi:hypothetical protein